MVEPAERVEDGVWEEEEEEGEGLKEDESGLASLSSGRKGYEEGEGRE